MACYLPGQMLEEKQLSPSKKGDIMKIQTAIQDQGEVLTEPIHSGPQFTSIQTINDSVHEASAWVRPLEQEMGRVIIGQRQLFERLLVGLLSNGHILLEGVPGLAKTLALKTLAATLPGITGFWQVNGKNRTMV